MNASVIISFFNKLDVLKKTLAGFERQSFKDFEIIIADDGSNEEIVNDLTIAIQESTLRVLHVWHENRGWRKNAVLNLAISKSNSEYLIFVDGDCIPHKDFVLDHIKHKQKGELLTGRRVRLSEKLTSRLTIKMVSNGWLESDFHRIMLDGIIGKSIQVEKGIRLQFPWYKNKQRRNKPNRQVLGCNFSMYKDELIELNGFDERFQGPGIGEDIDIDLRFTNSGNKVMLLRYCAIQFHLYHKKIQRHSLDDNLLVYEEHKKSRVIQTSHGLNKKRP